MFLDNRYASPQLLETMTPEWNIIDVGKCRENIIGFEREALNLENKVERGYLLRLVEK